MKETEKEWILSLSQEKKIMFLEAMLKEEQYNIAFVFMDVLLKAPLSQGGLSTEVINEVWKKYVNK